MIRVSDYIAQRLAALKLEQVFMITGGGAMHLNDAFGRVKELKVAHCHHEQACAMAADAYFRIAGKPAIVNVTTGPGGTNALTGVYGAFTDSVGMICISGQVKWETLVPSTGLNLRQLGDQEVDIVAMAKPITKYAAMITDPFTVRYEVEKAVYLATEGRPGPVWLDVPMNVQGAVIDETKLVGFTPPPVAHRPSKAVLGKLADVLLEKLKAAERPVIMVGGGIRISGAHKEFIAFAEKLGVPVTTCWNAHDVIWDSHPLYVGRPGTIGNRGGNFAVQNSDFVLILGSRLNIRQISYNWPSFAPNAYKVMVDVDELEMKKPTLSIDLPIHAHLADFFDVMSLKTIAPTAAHTAYLAKSRARNLRYPVVTLEQWAVKDSVNPYCFSQALSEALPENELIVTGDGTACVVTFQASVIKKGQRLFTNSGCASMGFDLPAAIGAHFAAHAKRLICIAGDGSLMMNIQELQTLVHHKVPVKLFVFNNLGYHSIRQTQRNFFPDNVIGCGTESGLSFPNFEKIATAFGFAFQRIQNHDELRGKIETTLNTDGPILCEVMLDLDQQFAPKLSSRKLADGTMVTSSMEDMAPFLSREELAEKHDSRPTSKFMKLSILIPCYNSAKYLETLVPALCSQVNVGLRESVEIIVADNASTDRTPSVITELEKNYTFKYARYNEHVLTAEENIFRGVHSALGEWTWVLGSDDNPSHSAIADILTNLDSTSDHLLFNYALVDTANQEVNSSLVRFSELSVQLPFVELAEQLGIWFILAGDFVSNRKNVGNEES